MTTETERTTCLRCGRSWDGTKEENAKSYDAHHAACSERYEKEHRYEDLTPRQLEVRKVIALESIADSLHRLKWIKELREGFTPT